MDIDRKVFNHLSILPTAVTEADPRIKTSLGESLKSHRNVRSDSIENGSSALEAKRPSRKSLSDRLSTSRDAP